MPGGYTLFVKDVNIDRRLMKNGLEIPHDNLETVTKNGNTTTIHTSFLNPDISLNTAGDIVIGGDSKTMGNVFVGSNVQIIDTGSNVITVNGNVVAKAFILSDGSSMTSMNLNLRRLTENGNTTTIHTSFLNPDISLNTAGDIVIGGDSKTMGNLFVGSNVHIIDTGSNVITVNGNIVANAFILSDGTKLTGLNLQKLIEKGNTTTIHTSFLNPNISLNTVGNAVFGSPSNVTVDTTNRKVTFSSNIAINSTLPNASISIGNSAGQTNQQNRSIAIGYLAGMTSQGSESIAIGDSAGSSDQRRFTVAIGYWS